MLVRVAFRALIRTYNNSARVCVDYGVRGIQNDEAEFTVVGCVHVHSASTLGPHSTCHEWASLGGSNESAVIPNSKSSPCCLLLLPLSFYSTLCMAVLSTNVPQLR